MKFVFSSRGLFFLGLLLLVLTNIAVLDGVAVNRSGSPETQIVLTEREVQIPYRSHKENSGLALHLKWRVAGVGDDAKFSSRWNSPAWFDADKLKKLGFLIPDYDRSDDSFKQRKQPVTKEVFIVLENESPLFQKIIKRLEKALDKEKKLLLADRDDKELTDRVKNAEERLKRERIAGSRLFVVDAGLNPRQLRGQYPDRTRFIITKGKVNYRYNYSGDGKEKKQEITGYVSGLSVANIHVPLQYRQKFDFIREHSKSRGKNDSTRYQVELAYGHRFEPWLVSIQKVPEK